MACHLCLHLPCARDRMHTTLGLHTCPMLPLPYHAVPTLTCLLDSIDKSRFKQFTMVPVPLPLKSKPQLSVRGVHTPKSLPVVTLPPSPLPIAKTHNWLHAKYAAT